MTQLRQVHKPTKIIRDADPKYLPSDASYFMQNAERSINGDGTLGKIIPMAGTELLCELEEDLGNGYWVGGYRSPLTNEVYLFRYLPEGINYILRINEDSTCQVVYQGECLFLSATPENMITDWRVYLKFDKICAHRHGKQLIWVDGSDTPIGQLDVEASIATNSFSTDFFAVCSDPCASLQMCVPSECGALQGEFIPLEDGDEDLPNHMVDVGIQLRYRFIYYDQRASEWSDISTLFFQDAKGCFDSAEGLPRCLRLRVPIGNPLVERIEIAFSTNNGLQWYSSDTIEKYLPYTSEEQYWYERELADLENFSEEDCAFDYIFCNDKECETISQNETNRVVNPMPRGAQGLFRIKNSLAFYNYIKGNCPLLVSETKKVQVSLNCDDAEACNEEYVTLIVRAIVYNNREGQNQFIYREGGTAGDSNTADDKTDVAYFGGQPAALFPLFGGEIKAGYDQFFTEETRNFIVYIEGTNIFAEMEQWRADANLGSPQKYGVVSSVKSIFLDNRSSFFYQQAEIQVKKGTRGYLRMVSHKQNVGTNANQNTSTFVMGVFNGLPTYFGSKDINSSVTLREDEIYFDTCDVEGDTLVIDNSFVVVDNNITNSQGEHSSSAYSGYITDEGNKPVFGAEVWHEDEIRGIADFNGFYHFYIFGDENDNSGGVITVSVRVEQNCSPGFSEVKTVTLNGGYNTLTKTNIQITDSDNPDYETDFLKIVNVTVLDCDTEPIAGIRVAMNGAKYQVTDVSGIASFRLRNISTRNRVVRGVVMNNNYCITLDCDGNCNPCMPQTASTSLSPCFTPVATVSINVDSNINRDSIYAGKRGLKAGGRYGWGVVVEGDCGQLSSVYPITIMDGSLDTGNYLDVPKTQAKGVLSFCDLTYDTNNIQLPLWAKCLKIVRTFNYNQYQLQWLVDDIERTADGKIVLTIQSLNDYNASYNFKTNTNYEFLEGDRVEFISNGGNSIFDIATFGLLNYQILSPFGDFISNTEDNTTIKYYNQILIDDDGKLDGLKIGAKIEIQRPKDCVEENTPYFEMGVSLPVQNISGATVILAPTGSFNTFDTYFVNRQVGKFAPTTFEHRNPSDFWGNALDGISDRGKVHFVNKYENERRYGRNFTINTENQFNRFGDFEKTLDAPEQGDLTAVSIYDGKIGLGIGENDNFLFQVSDDFLRVGSDGVVRAASVDTLISDTEPKISGIFGCKYEDIGSVLFGDGFVTWVDSSKSALVKHNFSSAKDVSDGKMQSWFRRKIQFTKALNGVSGEPESKYRWATGFNYFSKSVYLTIKSLTGESIYDNPEALLQNDETIRFEPVSEDFIPWTSCVPDFYSYIELMDDRGCAMVSAVGNKVWKHPIIGLAANYNKFYDTACNMYVGISINENQDKVRIAEALEIQSEQLFFVVSVLTDKPNFLSEIPPKRIKKTERKWNATFLYNINSRSGLYGNKSSSVGENARGYYIKVMLIKDNTVDLKYNTVNPAKQTQYNELDMILSKYMLSEQSGFSGDL